MNVGRGFRGRGMVNNARPAGDQADVGNRKSFDEIKVPPDNIGNKVEAEYVASAIHDTLGNSLDEEPSHLRSGILSSLQYSEKNQNYRNRRPSNSFQSQTGSRGPMQQSASPSNYPKRPMPPRNNQRPASEFQAEQYMAKLNADFAKLLKERSGMPFSFSMKACTDMDAQVADIGGDLEKLGQIIEQILASNTIPAAVTLMQYQTLTHHFAVFFIKPTEVDAVKNKELIAALRQVVNGYAARIVRSPINIFLVLANAQSVIEEHLFKIGAKKIDVDA